MALPVERLNARLEGEFRFRGRKISAPYALPGDLVQFEAGRRGVRIRHIERAAEYPPEIERDTPFCEAFGRCGGCRGQHLQYGYQLKLKTDPIVSAWQERFGLRPTITPAPALQSYRGRMDFVVDRGVVGQRMIGQFEQLVDLEHCPIQKPAADAALGLVRRALQSHPTAAYCRTTREGAIKFATIRSGKNSGIVALTIVADGIATPECQAVIDALSESLARLEAETATAWGLVLCPVPPESELSAPPGGQALRGEGTFREALGGRDFEIPYDGFFQPNPGAFELILNQLRVMAGAASAIDNNGAAAGDLVDLYCGAGALSALLLDWFPDRWQKVYGYELSAASVALAAANVARPGVGLKYQTLDLNAAPAGLLSERRGMAIADPPRAGISKALRRELIEAKGIAALLYVSCNPDSKLSDLADLSAAFQPVQTEIVDCYPHTPHLEQVTLLLRREQGSNNHSPGN